KYRVIKSNFLKFSSSYVYNDNDGFIELLVNEEDRIIGAGIISLFAAELINILSLCIKNNLTLSDLKKNVFIHPTLSEIIPLLLLV
ncbi:MAG: dihydrolipoyl dehydrogenase, partial [Candidatus Omnitrophica bacterium]|nr:dihydrolipoyl dehydrogenase [Candidatus Omnitrophota bacterium]